MRGNSLGSFENLEWHYQNQFYRLKYNNTKCEWSAGAVG